MNPRAYGALAMAMDPDFAAVRNSDASTWLAAPSELVQSAKATSERLFSLAVKYVPKAPLRRLLTEGFDAEQIWQQIEIQDRPLISSVRRQLRHLEKLAVEDVDLFGINGAVAGEKFPKTDGNAQNGHVGSDEEDADDSEGNGEEDGIDNEDGPSDGSEDNPGDDKEDEDEDDVGAMNVVEDKFLKMKDMEKFLENAEAEYEGRDAPANDEDDDGSDDEMVDARSEDENDSEQIRYDDFFGKTKNKVRFEDTANDGGEENEVGDDDDSDQNMDPKVNEKQSTHEKQVEKIQKRIEQLEKANLDAKDWTMRGEATASKRPKNSALEVELDFEHNVRPAPVITEEVTASIEDIIRKRIIEGQFDDVERKQKLPEMPPAERREIDETKSTKGLGEIYEDEYMQSTGLSAPSTTESDVFKKEATILFKSLCLKLDALSHFHFAPKPVVEDMTVREHIPALAMEEVAPVFASEASMLAPEEVFTGKGAIKDEKELDRSDRKRRRAVKKRKFKAELKTKEQLKRPRRDDKTSERPGATVPKKQSSTYSKSAKVFAELDRAKTEGNGKLAAKNKEAKVLQPSSLKL